MQKAGGLNRLARKFIVMLSFIFVFGVLGSSLIVSVGQAESTSSSSATTSTANNSSTSNTPIIITNAEGLNAIRDNLDRDYILGADIDLTSYPNWEPIGNFSSDNRFTGNFDGAGYKITNLNIDRQSQDYVGLFGYVENGVIKNVTLENVNVKGKNNVGGIVALLDGVNSQLENVHISGSVVGGSYLGGLVGYVKFGSIQKSSSSASVTCLQEYNCYATGGLVGDIIPSNTSPTINESFATGDVTGVSRVGGLAGVVGQRVIVKNSFASGKVVGIDVVGGLVGSNSAPIVNSYAVGTVNGESNPGGLIGIGSTGSSITNSFYDSETSGQSDTGKGVPKSTEEMQDKGTFTGWDFSTVWFMPSDNYPQLQWVNNQAPPAPLYVLAVQVFDDIRVPIGTDLSTIFFPEEVRVILSNEHKINVPVEWDAGTPMFDPNMVGEYTFNGTITLPEGVTNPENLSSSQKVRVSADEQAPLYVANVESLEDLEVVFGTALDDIPFPNEVEITLSDESTMTVNANWVSGKLEYDQYQPGPYEFMGELVLPEHVGNPDHLAASLTVIVLPAQPQSLTVDSVEELAPNTVVYDTDRDSLPLPEEVEVTLNDGSKLTVEVAWDDGAPAYVKTTAGEYQFVGALHLPEGVTNPEELVAKIKVVVLPLPKATDEEEEEEELEEELEEDADDEEEESAGKVGSTDNKKESGKKLPATATNLFNLLLIGTSLLIIGGLLFFIRKKKATL
ncbi:MULTISPECIES: Ig-like domain-containing protein [Bacillaceae]|uniref:Ig-like domain-containing protein n=1 Tax=Evansella alkalicola TaxID=745819 RepID=A0ABS6JXD8_9BACI|nr:MULTISPECIES: Ig-like domain-containing protein [Bacillaceae]MBU9723244.1 Ig-like domain-containing protein [Bacillus alkalicola]